MSATTTYTTSEKWLRFLAGVALLPPSWLLSAYTFATLWRWFIVPVWPVDPLTVSQAAGIGCLLAWLKVKVPRRSDPDDYTGLQMMATGLMLNVVALATGWIIHVIITH